ncbi:MAG: hypothetical protein MIO92_16305 [Methanosarcinaceae archaeon]|nr:hypothetical protein [Methanosarcinaceae archaeon]
MRKRLIGKDQGFENIATGQHKPVKACFYRRALKENAIPLVLSFQRVCKLSYGTDSL